MKITRKGYFTITGPDGELLQKPDGKTRQTTGKDESFEYITEDGRDGTFTIHSPDTEVEIEMLFGSADTIVFQESFDAQDDWVCSDGQNSVPQTVPPDWDYVYAQETWHPDNDASASYACEISGANSNQLFGGTGKAYVTDVESNNGSGFSGSDGMIYKDLPEADEYYYEVRIRFENDFHETGIEGDRKLLRIMHWDASDQRQKNFVGGANGPIAFFNWKRSGGTDGIRHKHALRGPPATGASYAIVDPTDITDNPVAIVNNGDMSANWKTQHSLNLVPDQDNLPNDIPDTGEIQHSQVYGNVWHRIGIYVKLNSAAGVLDGQYKFWFDDLPIVAISQLAWVPSGFDPADFKWNLIALGGNSDYHWDPSATWSAAREKWISYDDLKIYSTIPVRLQI